MLLQVEDVVSVPLAQFQQMVELLAEAVREIKSARQVQPDLERGHTNIARQRNGLNKCLHQYCDFPHGQYPKEEEMAYCQKAINDLWNSVDPFDVARLSVMLEEPSQEPTSPVDDSDPNDTQSDRCENAIEYPNTYHWERERQALLAHVSSNFKMFHSPNDIYREYTENKGECRLYMGRVLSSCVASILSHGKSQIGDILFECYQSEAIQRPNPSLTLYYINAIVLLLMIDDGYSITHIFSYSKAVEKVIENKPINILLGMDISNLLQIIHLSFLEPLVLEGSKGSTFTTDDLNVQYLKSIGGLSIRWTDTFKDHLRLDLKTKKLHIAWFSVGAGRSSAVDTCKQTYV